MTKSWIIGLLFPETDEEVLEFDSQAEITNLCHNLMEIKGELDSKRVSYQFYYDSENMKAFVHKINDLFGDIYLNDSLAQLRRIVGNRSRNIKNGESLFQTDCCYIPWNMLTHKFDDAPNLLKVLSEENLNENNDAYLLSLQKADKYKRDYIPVIKDALHIIDMPKLVLVKYCHPVCTFLNVIQDEIKSRKFSLRDVARFERTKFVYNPTGQRIYFEKECSRYWYYDFFHKGKGAHYEVFDCTSFKHIAEADMDGNLDETKRDANKSIKKYVC